MIANKEEKILAAAVACLATHGFQASTSQLALAAGVGEATLLRPFANKAALVAATYPYVLAQLTADLAQAGPQPGESLRAVLARWWELTAQAALAHPAVFACWRLWRGSANAPSDSLFGPFAGVRPLLHQALGTVGVRQRGPVPTWAVVPGLAAHWGIAVELAQVRQATQPEWASAGALPLLQALYASWWTSTGWEEALPAQPAAASLTGIMRLQQKYNLLERPTPNGDF